MKTSIKRLISVFLVCIMALSCSAVTCAAESTENESGVTSTSTENVEIMPRGQISGYAQGTITAQRNNLIVYCDSSTIFESGMGITIKASSANFNGYVIVSGSAKQGTAKSFSNQHLDMGTEIYVGNLTHRNCSAYEIIFEGLSEGESFTAEVWIYG